MATAHETQVLPKVYYRPLEAAIRWSGLTEHEERILCTLKRRHLPGPRDFPEWPLLRLNAERILDGISNDELPHGVAGITVPRRAKVKDARRLTIRHIDLKAWISRYYPDERPGFLFSPIEQELLPITISSDSLKALTLERSALRLRVQQLNETIQRLNSDVFRRRPDNNITKAASKSHDDDEHTLSNRGETTYLHILGGLIDVLLRQSPAGQHYSVFTSQDAIINAVVAFHGNKLGISKRTLEQKFASARRTLTES